jgi:hypothetical protein
VVRYQVVVSHLQTSKTTHSVSTRLTRNAFESINVQLSLKRSVLALTKPTVKRGERDSHEIWFASQNVNFEAKHRHCLPLENLLNESFHLVYNKGAAMWTPAHQMLVISFKFGEKKVQLHGKSVVRWC